MVSLLPTAKAGGAGAGADLERAARDRFHHEGTHGAVAIIFVTLGFEVGEGDFYFGVLVGEIHRGVELVKVGARLARVITELPHEHTIGLVRPSPVQTTTKLSRFNMAMEAIRWYPRQSD